MAIDISGMYVYSCRANRPLDWGPRGLCGRRGGLWSGGWYWGPPLWRSVGVDVRGEPRVVWCLVGDWRALGGRWSSNGCDHSRSLRINLSFSWLNALFYIFRSGTTTHHWLHPPPPVTHQYKHFQTPPLNSTARSRLKFQWPKILMTIG